MPNCVCYLMSSSTSLNTDPLDNRTWMILRAIFICKFFQLQKKNGYIQQFSHENNTWVCKLKSFFLDILIKDAKNSKATSKMITYWWDYPRWWNRKTLSSPLLKGIPKLQLCVEQPSMKKTGTYQKISSTTRM